MKYVIWHNPRCSKSRAALEILQTAGVELEVRRYQDAPPNAAEILAVVRSMARPVRDLVRFCEACARELRLKDADKTDAEWAQVLADNPTLIERPVVISSDGRAVLGRPPEAVRDLL
ncbi:MAG: arsenate reductase (glutaredoxin) [Acidobacteria bacterium]|nr:arsenate reductase (glutaredoxin) [Acidobacteriota bacterium]